MTPTEFYQILETRTAKCRAEMGVKNQDYAAPEDGDFLKNFYDTAERTGLTPLQAWGVHFTKHIIAIERYVRTGGLASEPIDGRIGDAINYLHLLDGLIEESKNDKAITFPSSRAVASR